MRHRVVVTGLGVVSPLGNTLQETRSGLSRAASGIRPLTDPPSQSFPFKRAGAVRGFNPRDYGIRPKSLKVMNKTIQYAIAAACLAGHDARLAADASAPAAVGIALGVDGIQYAAEDGMLAACEAAGGDLRNYFPGAQADAGSPITVRDPARAVHPLWPLSVLANMAVCHIAIEQQLPGPTVAISSTDAGGAQAIGEAFKMLQDGGAEAFLAGGSFALTSTAWVSLACHGLLAQSGTAAPFDAAGDGCVPGEGAAVLVLERLERALARSAPIYAELTGFGSVFDGRRAPRAAARGPADCYGMLACMRAALADAGIDAAALDCVNADGCGVAARDLQEARAIAALLGERAGQVPVSGTKALSGHLFSAAGAFEALATVLSLADGVIPGSGAPQCGTVPENLQLLTNTLKKDIKCAISNTFGFTGENASLVFQTYS